LFGIGAETYWSPDGNKSKSLLLKTAGSTKIVPAPGGEAVLVATPASGGVNISVNYNIEAIGQLTTDYKTPLSGLVWKLTDYADSLQYDNSDYLKFLKYTFSDNGRYLLGQLSTGAIVKLDLITQKYRVFANEYRVINNMTISNDGKTSLIHRSGNIVLYNSGLCGTEHTLGSLPSVNPVINSCVLQANLSTKIKELYPSVGLITASKFRFGLNSTELFVDGSWVVDGVRSWNRFKFTPKNYVASNRGYLAMGDSFSSGEGDLGGDQWYEKGTDEHGNPETFEGRNLCHLSRRSYPYLMAVELGYLGTNSDSPPADGFFHSVACSGAWTHNVKGNNKGLNLGQGSAESFNISDNQYRNDNLGILGVWQPGRIKQTDILNPDVLGGYSESQSKPEVITLGIGGNDAGFGGIIASCAMPGTCKYAEKGSLSSSELAMTLASLKDEIVESYNEVKKSSPDSRIYVHGYPVFVKGYGGNCGINTPLNAEETALVEEGVKYMNSVVKAAAAEAGVFYVDVSDILSGRNLCSGVEDEISSFNGATKGDDRLSIFDNKIAELVSNLYIIGDKCYFRTGCLGSESFHPNNNAHKLYAQAILDQTAGLTLDMPEPTNQPYPVPDSFFGNLAIEHINKVNDISGFITDYEVVIKQPSSFLSYKDKNTVDILQDNFYPNSAVSVSHQSTPTEIGQYLTDENGVLTQEITLPETLTNNSGVHEVHIDGVDKFGNPVNYYQQISIAYNELDFDGDKLANEVDSCPTLQNSSVDVDRDGLDDVCDGEVLANQQTQDNQNQEEFVGLEKGQPNPETVAGNEQLSRQPQVLSDFIDVSEQGVLSENTLSNTGIASIFVTLCGFILITLSVLFTLKKVN
jgi:hypothetical protein